MFCVENHWILSGMLQFEVPTILTRSLIEIERKAVRRICIACVGECCQVGDCFVQHIDSSLSENTFNFLETMTVAAASVAHMYIIMHTFAHSAAVVCP